jgi:hypothetical protein
VCRSVDAMRTTPGSGRKEASAAMKRGLKVGRAGVRDIDIKKRWRNVCVCVCVLDGRVERTYLVGRGESREGERGAFNQSETRKRATERG